MNNYIKIFDDAISSDDCKKIIFLFETDERKDVGRVNVNIHNPKVKNSVDIHPNIKDNVWMMYNTIIRPSLTKCLDEYVNTYKVLQISPMWKVSDLYNIQRYADGEGYFDWHTEHSPYDPLRILAWMFYLNDSECGTEFYHQDLTIEAKKGRCVIWPAGWTHFHKGVTPNVGMKYIATGWCEFFPPNTDMTNINMLTPQEYDKINLDK